jgi:hypothetical protein
VPVAVNWTGQPVYGEMVEANIQVKKEISPRKNFRDFLKFPLSDVTQNKKTIMLSKFHCK